MGCIWRSQGGAARGFSRASRGLQLEGFGGPEISWTSKLKFSGILRNIAVLI